MAPHPSSAIVLRNADIVRRRQNGVRPSEIGKAMDLSASRVIDVIREARNEGIEFPDLPRLAYRGGGRKHRHVAETSGADEYREPKQKRKLPPEELTIDEELRLRELAQRNLGLTAIATLMRKRYLTIDAAMVRLGLSRAGVT